MSELTQVLRHLVPVDDPNALVDASTGDDAAVYRIAPDRALVVTADFFTPIVDDPFDFGRVAAANALSDLYAMGARPLFALNLVGFPRKLLGEGLLEEILRGGGEACRDAGIPVLGGHSIDDPEPKFGLVAVGEAHPDRLVTNAGARPGDVLVLTKPLGGGVTTTALKQQKASDEDVKEAIEWMSRLNKTAGQLAVEFDLHGGTDITGFGFLGHGLEMAEASGVMLSIQNSQIPLLGGARGYAEKGLFPGGAFDNMAYVGKSVKFDKAIDEPSQMLLFDPQTSGGLLLGVPREKLADFQKRAGELNQPVWVVGKVRAGQGIEVHA